MGIPLYHVDSFTAEPFKGNPAGVCLLPEPREENWMQSLARELKHSETAFLVPKKDGFSLRWFTPGMEVDLCGHATLASAHVLWERGILKENQTARFETKSGWLSASKQGDWIEMDFPAEVAVLSTAPAALSEALGVEASTVYKNRLHYLVELPSEKALHSLKPNFPLLARIPLRGCIVTCRSESPKFDFLSRYFAPLAGIDEDPVTGSAHCSLGPYWKERLGKSELLGFQASSRGGVVRVRVELPRVFLGGQAVTVFSGELRG